jgi:hypothetical protein
VPSVREKTYVHRIRWENIKERNHFEGLGAESNTVLKWIWTKNERAWNGLIWLRIRINNGLL